MKILFIIDSLDKGGKERRMLELIKGLTRESGRFQILLVCLTNRVEYDYVYNLPIEFLVLERKYKKDPSIIFKLKKLIGRFDPDVIHSWSTMSSVYIMLATLFRRRKFINGVVADAPLGLTWKDPHYLRLKLTTWISHRIISNSKAGLAAYRVPASKGMVIYNGVDLNRFTGLPDPESIKARFLSHIPEASFVVAMVASFSELKDYDTAIKAAIRLCQQDPGMVFLLIGEGHLLESDKAKVPADLLGKQIIFTGKQHQVEAILQIIDLGILISNAQLHGEGVSNSIIEYMFMGKPVVATRGGGTTEVIRDGENGFLVPNFGTDAIVEKISWLRDHPEERKRMGETAARFAREQFSIHQKAQQYIDLYESLVHPAGPRSVLSLAAEQKNQ